MKNDLSYTAEELAALLKISKLTVYDLIKKGKLPAYRVGKQMRVDAVDLEAFKTQEKELLRGQSEMLDGSGPPFSAVLPRDAGTSPTSASSTSASLTSASSTSASSTSASSAPASSTPPVYSFAPASSTPRTLVITGQDVGLDLLARQIETRIPELRPLRSQAGSLDSLVAMYRGEADLVSMHLLDGDTGEYNVPYVRKLLVGVPCIVVRLLSRQAGLFAAKGNPKRIGGWPDLGRADVHIVNRERGSGARVLLDEQLRLHGIRRAEVNGYAEEETNHLAIAGKVATGNADTGVGIEKAAAFVGVDFIPLISEQYDLVMRRTPANEDWIERIIGLIRSDAFLRELGAIPGYDLSETGRVIWEA